jgi:hypothetical protein
MAALSLLVPLLPSGVRAQGDIGADFGGDLNHPVLLGVNALLGGLTAGVGRWLSGGPIHHGVGWGLAGGALGYTGRLIAVQDFSGAGLLGRQVNGVGTSLVANAVANRAALSRLDLPVGPVVLRFEPASGLLPSPRVRVWDAAWLVSGLLDSRLELDWKESVSSGAPVFQAPDHLLEGGSTGQYIGGVIVLGLNHRPNTLAHERVHVLQFDQLHGYWGGPLEDWAATHVLPGGIAAPGWLEAGIAAPLMVWALSDGLSLEPDQRPWEAEADFLAGRSGSR